MLQVLFQAYLLLTLLCGCAAVLCPCSAYHTAFVGARGTIHSWSLPPGHVEQAHCCSGLLLGPVCLLHLCPPTSPASHSRGKGVWTVVRGFSAVADGSSWHFWSWADKSGKGDMRCNFATCSKASGRQQGLSTRDLAGFQAEGCFCCCMLCSPSTTPPLLWAWCCSSVAAGGCVAPTSGSTGPAATLTKLKIPLLI